MIPVFAPPRETGFQASIERYNGLWQRGVWERFHFKNHQQLIEQSKKYADAFRDKKHDSIQAAPNRYVVPDDFVFRCDEPPKGTIIFIKRTDNNGIAKVMGNNWMVDSLWTNRLVRVEMILKKKVHQFLQIKKTRTK
jgi:hypothetical protein